MNYLPRNRTRNRYSKPLFFLAAIFVLGFLFFYFLNGFIISAVAPLWRAEEKVKGAAAGITGFFHSKQTLTAENQNLKEKVSSLEVELSARSSAQEKEDALLQLLGRKSEVGGVAATALAGPPETLYDIVVIDSGSKEGVIPGAQVFLPEGPLLGTVSEVFARSAKVLLFSAPGVKTNAVLERHSVPVTLEGAGGGNFKIMVPRETAVEVGDRILSADIAAHFLAVVGGINMKPTDSFKEVLAKSPVNIFSIHFLLVRP